MSFIRLINRVLNKIGYGFVGYQQPISPPTQDIAGSVDALWKEVLRQNRILKETEARSKTNRADINVIDVRLGKIKDVL